MPNSKNGLKSIQEKNQKQSLGFVEDNLSGRVSEVEISKPASSKKRKFTMMNTISPINQSKP